MQNSYEKRSKLHYSEKKVDSVEKLSKKMEYYDKLFNQVIQIYKKCLIFPNSLKPNFPNQTPLTRNPSRKTSH